VSVVLMLRILYFCRQFVINLVELQQNLLLLLKLLVLAERRNPLLCPHLNWHRRGFDFLCWSKLKHSSSFQNWWVWRHFQFWHYDLAVVRNKLLVLNNFLAIR
jgi:hypothetical protein